MTGFNPKWLILILWCVESQRGQMILSLLKLFGYSTIKRKPWGLHKRRTSLGMLH